MNQKARVLVCDDDSEIREVLRLLLSSDGYEVTEAASGESCVLRADEGYDLVILDVKMPGIDGYAACAEIRKKTNAPVLFLTARSGEEDKAYGFAAGGDDYLVKPFSYVELLSRVKAMIRRFRDYGGAVGERPRPVLSAGGVTIEPDGKTVRCGDTEINLTDTEYRILSLLISNRRRIYSVRELYESVWEEPYLYVSNNTVMVHIRNLRRKLYAAGGERTADIIKTVWGKGYRVD